MYNQLDREEGGKLFRFGIIKAPKFNLSVLLTQQLAMSVSQSVNPKIATRRNKEGEEKKKKRCHWNLDSSKT